MKEIHTGCDKSGEKKISNAKHQKNPTDVEPEKSDEALLDSARTIARNTSPVRRNRVEEMKKKVNAGSYSVDAEKVAEKIISEHIETDFGKNRL